MLFDASRENRQEITRFVGAEIQNQVKALGLATKRDLDRMERRLERVEASTRRSAVKTTAAKKTAVRKPVARKSTVKKTTGRGAGPPWAADGTPSGTERPDAR
jgi:hypothetical protein